MPYIAHHAYDRDRLENYYAVELESIETALQIFGKGKYFVLRDMYDKTLAAACCAVVLGKGKDEIRQRFQLFLDVAIGKYKMGTNVGTPITFSLLGEDYQYTPEPKNYGLTDQGWNTAFFAALLFLDIDKINELGSIDLDEVMSVDSAKGGEHTLAFARFLQHVFAGDQDNFANLKRASDLLKPELMPAAIHDFAIAITGGQIDLFGAALLKEEAHFNEVLARAVQWHKDFYARHNPQSEQGLFALELTAICVLAKRYNLAIEQTSDYTPALFVDGF